MVSFVEAWLVTNLPTGVVLCFVVVRSGVLWLFGGGCERALPVSALVAAYGGGMWMWASWMAAGLRRRRWWADFVADVVRVSGAFVGLFV